MPGTQQVLEVRLSSSLGLVKLGPGTQLGRTDGRGVAETLNDTCYHQLGVKLRTSQSESFNIYGVSHSAKHKSLKTNEASGPHTATREYSSM